MRISDWSSDVCSSDLCFAVDAIGLVDLAAEHFQHASHGLVVFEDPRQLDIADASLQAAVAHRIDDEERHGARGKAGAEAAPHAHQRHARRSEEHTSELQSLMRIPYAVFCLKKKNKYKTTDK